MRLPWNKSKEVQLDLLDAEPGSAASHQPVAVAPRAVVSSRDAAASPAAAKHSLNYGRPLLVVVSMLYEDAHNPRTEFPDESIAELAEDIQQRGVLLGLSHGEYVARLVDGSRLPQPVAERQADRAALLASNDRMAALSTDLVALVTLLRQAKVEQARPYRDRLETADAEIRRHLDQASALIDRL